MDGQTALKFARSRHGNNGEGSDFARSERQQKIILAVKDKVLSASTFRILTPVSFPMPQRPPAALKARSASTVPSLQQESEQAWTDLLNDLRRSFNKAIQH